MRKPNPAIQIYHGRTWPVGLHNAAKRLGVSAGHLYQVLKGRRISPEVKEGYQALVAELNASES